MAQGIDFDHNLNICYENSKQKMKGRSLKKVIWYVYSVEKYQKREDIPDIRERTWPTFADVRVSFYLVMSKRTTNMKFATLSVSQLDKFVQKQIKEKNKKLHSTCLVHNILQ